MFGNQDFMPILYALWLKMAVGRAGVLVRARALPAAWAVGLVLVAWFLVLAFKELESLKIHNNALPLFNLG